MITYRNSLEDISEARLIGFFVGWPNPPSPAIHRKILKGSSNVILALDDDRVIGFINAISDGVLSAYIPLLEVLPEYQGRGIGRELVRRMLEQLKELYMIDLCCDDSIRGFYEKLGMRQACAMNKRNYEHQSGASRS